ncbi:MAG: efflux RND transporter periplasmic adaptor subunit [Gammaproteobacteria bacterium]|nr:efflux RND transporter periplasmic adaptor subunit [Gammaproteobacteria bacterium]
MATKIVLLFIQLSLAMFWVACSESNQKSATPASAPSGKSAPPPPLVITVFKIEAKPTQVYNELTGRVATLRSADVRARVPGVVLKKYFEEGNYVQAGALLFQLDPRAQQIALDSAEANLLKSRANLQQAELKLSRNQLLLESQFIAQQVYDDSLNAVSLAKADIAIHVAAVDAAKLNLDYTEIRAPIGGRIGKAMVTEGALVGQGQATLMALIQQIHPIVVNLNQPIADYLTLRKNWQNKGLLPTNQPAVQVELTMDDGSVYPHKGHILFSDFSIDETSGNYLVRAQFPNQGEWLQPGMYVNAKIWHSTLEKAITIPQKAIVRNPSGTFVYVVDSENKIRMQEVQAKFYQNNQMLISNGLHEGDVIAIDGLQKLNHGVLVQPKTVGEVATPEEKTKLAPSTR